METIFKNVTAPEVFCAIGFNNMPDRECHCQQRRRQSCNESQLRHYFFQYHILLGTQAEWLERLPMPK
jgi:hypothetical protein